jgi:hypothetical protein
MDEHCCCLEWDQASLKVIVGGKQDTGSFLLPTCLRDDVQVQGENRGGCKDKSALNQVVWKKCYIKN